MKKALIVSVLFLCLAAIAFATLRSSHQKNTTKIEKKKEIKKKRSCNHVCPFS